MFSYSVYSSNYTRNLLEKVKDYLLECCVEHSGTQKSHSHRGQPCGLYFVFKCYADGVSEKLPMIHEMIISVTDSQELHEFF